MRSLASSDSVIGLSKSYKTMDLAQAAITAGTIPNNGLFSTISTDPLQTYAIWQNVNGTPTAVLEPSTGAQKTYPSGAAVDAVAESITALSGTVSPLTAALASSMPLASGTTVATVGAADPTGNNLGHIVSVIIDLFSPVINPGNVTQFMEKFDTASSGRQVQFYLISIANSVLTVKYASPLIDASAAGILTYTVPTVVSAVAGDYIGVWSTQSLTGSDALSVRDSGGLAIYHTLRYATRLPGLTQGSTYAQTAFVEEFKYQPCLSAVIMTKEGPFPIITDWIGKPGGVAGVGSDGKIDPDLLTDVITVSPFTPVAAALASDTPLALISTKLGQQNPTLGQTVNHLRGNVILTSETSTISGAVDVFTMKFDTVLSGRLAQCYILRSDGSGGYKCVYSTGDFDASASGVVSFSPIDQALIQSGDVIGCFSTATAAVDSLSCKDSGGSANPIGATTLRFGNLPISRFVVGTTYSASTTGALTSPEFYPTLYAHISIVPMLMNNDWGGKANGPLILTAEKRIPEENTRASDAFWQGKTIFFCGMSITANGAADFIPGSTTVRNGYVYQVGKMLNATIINNAVPGSKMTFTADDSKSFSATIDELVAAGLVASDKRETASSFENLLLGKTADLRILDFGINDRNATIGTIADTTNTTLYGAYNYVWTRLFAENPLYQVVLMTPHTLYAGSNSNERTPAIRQAIINIGKKFCVLVLDWTESVQLSSVYAPNWLVDGLHPGQAWHNMAARRLYDFVKSL